MFLREPKTGTKISSKFLSIISVFSFYLFYNTVRCVFVCLFVKCAYAREETCASSSFAGTCNTSNSTKRHKKREKPQKTRASSSFAGTCNPSNSTKGTRKEKNNKKHVQVLHLQELATLLTAQKAQERRKTTKNTCKFFICRVFHTF